ncbi:hypothetical protein MJA45_05440 [Paenibacillus aurantius]|uniref:SHOCT domain-containing protein n=1 Tax=Paenibacillus aurantius TaxID=2918900 RepID=A0AA96RIR9_9BACL|nr:hypothetical protein [Paenibacillus aurantius]WNQ12479.1 hypothetical protein MJA45_05440 [Paenibacillus aurantius]
MLVQRSKLTTKTFRIVDNGLVYSTKRWLEKMEYFMPFEELSSRRVEFTVFPKKSFFGALAFLALSAAFFMVSLFGQGIERPVGPGLVCLGAAAVCGFLCWLHYDSYIRIGGFEGNLDFFHSKPSREETEKFIERLNRQKKTFLAKRLTRSLEASTETVTLSDELYKLAKLVEYGVLTREEFAQLKARLTKSAGTEPAAPDIRH